jgi:ABC-2 type transport system permease protein
VVLAFSFTWGSLAFWSPRAAEETSSAAMNLIGQLKPFPLDGLSRVMKDGLLTALPVGFVAWYPSRALLGLDASSASVYVTPLAACAFLLVAGAIFTQGCRHYEKTGSQRYLPHGHRR